MMLRFAWWSKKFAKHRCIGKDSTYINYYAALAVFAIESVVLQTPSSTPSSRLFDRMYESNCDDICLRCDLINLAIFLYSRQVPLWLVSEKKVWYVHVRILIPYQRGRYCFEIDLSG